MLSKNQILMSVVEQFPAVSHKVRFNSIDVEFGIESIKELRLVAYPEFDKYVLVVYSGNAYCVIKEKVEGFNEIVEFFADNFELPILAELSQDIKEWIE